MRTGRVLWGLAGTTLALAAGCGREFPAPPAPPPSLEIVDFEPKHGFQGDLIAVCGRNLGTADPDSMSLLAFFGAQAAEVVLPVPADLPLACADERVALRVPSIAGDAVVEITLSSATSQDTSDDLFRYRGPGHPEGEETGESLRIASAPSSVSVVLPFEKMPFLNPALVTNTTARSLSVMDWETGWHVDFGLGAMPLSAAFVPQAALADIVRPGDELKPAEQQVRGTAYPVPIYLTAMDVVPPEGGEPGRVETLLLQQRLELFVPAGGARNRFEVFMQAIGADDPYALELPLAAPGEPPFQPYQVFQFCLSETPSMCAQGICEDRLLVLTELTSPRLALYSYRPCAQEVVARGVVELSPEGSLCADASGAGSPGAVVDVELAPVRHEAGLPPPAARMHVVVADRPEVWTVTVDWSADPWVVTPALSWPSLTLEDLAARVLAICRPAQGTPPAACSDPDLLGAALALVDMYRDTIAGVEPCKVRHAALAMLAWDEGTPVQTLYFSEPNLRTVFEAHYLNRDVVVQGQTYHVDAYAPLRKLALPSPAFALAAWNDEHGPYLGMACEDGARMVNTAFMPAGSVRQLQVDGFLGLPGSRGTPQSLTRYGEGGSSAGAKLLLADTVRDRLLVFPAGELYGDPIAHRVGVSQPQVAASQFSDLLYVADPLHNAIRLVDELSGVQDGQFSVQDISSFGATDITCLHDPAGDMLLAPLALDYNRALPGRARFREIITRGATSEDAVFDSGEMIGSGGTGAVGTRNPMDAGFNEILAAPRSGQLYLVSYEDDAAEGFVPGLWSALVAGGPESVTLMDSEEEIQLIRPEYSQVHMPLSTDTRAVRLDPEERALAVWAVDAQGTGTLEIFRNTAAEAGSDRPPRLASLTIAAPAAGLVSDVALHVRGEILTAYLALPASGHVMVLRPYRLVGADRDSALQTFLETAGVPARFAWSPDGRRLYVTHEIEGKLSILETDCMPAPGCQQGEGCEAGARCALGYCIPPGGACPAGLEDVSAGVGPESVCVPSLCERVRTSLAIPASPVKVVFHPSGKAAYVTHEGSGDITVVR